MKFTMIRKGRPRPKTAKRRRPARPKSSLGLQVAKTVGGYGLKLLKNKLGLNTEKNFLDTIQSSTALTTTAVHLTYALTIPQGDTQGTRNGSNIRLTNYNVTYQVNQNAAATVNQWVRVVFYARKQLNTITSATSDILQVNTNILSPYNMDTEGYEVIHDKTFRIDLSTPPAHQEQFSYTPFNFHLKWTNADTTGNIANLEAGLIRGFAYCSSATTPPSILSYTRVKWVDN